MAGKACWPELEAAGHIALAVGKQREVVTGDQLASPLYTV